MMTNITNEQIEQLCTEAGQVGDAAMVQVCDAALAGDPEARQECARVIADAAAMED